MLIPTNPPASTSVPVGSTLFVDATNGNNTTGLRGRFDKPFATPIAAAAAAQSGDLIVLGPGTFNIGGTQLALPSGVSMTGAGPGLLITPGTSADSFTPSGGTIIEASEVSGNQYVSVLPGSNCTISNLTIWMPSSSAATTFPTGFGKGDTGGTNVTLENVQVIGSSDGVYLSNAFGNTPTAYWKFINCTLATNFDAVNAIDASGNAYTSLIVDFFNCDIITCYDGSSGNNARCLAATTTHSPNAIVYNVFNTRLTSNGLSTSSPRCVDAGDATINLCSGSAVAYSITNTTYYPSLYAHSSGGVINVGPAFVFDASNISTGSGGVVQGMQPQILGTPSTSSAAGAAIGSTGTATLASGSTDESGQVTVTPGGSGITTGACAAITFGKNKRNCFPTITPANAAAAAIMQTDGIIPASTSATGFSISCGTALTSGTAYQFNYLCVGP